MPGTERVCGFPRSGLGDGILVETAHLGEKHGEELGRCTGKGGQPTKGCVTREAEVEGRSTSWEHWEMV